MPFVKLQFTLDGGLDVSDSAAERRLARRLVDRLECELGRAVRAGAQLPDIHLERVYEHTKETMSVRNTRSER